MSADILWTSSGTPLTAEQQFVRYAYGLREVHQAKRIQLDAFTPPSTEPLITISEGFYQNATTPQKQHVIIVATLPLELTAGQFARKPWLNVVAWGNEAIPAAYGVE